MKKAVRNTAIGLGLVSVLWGATAMAKGPGGHPGRGDLPAFSELDADGNGSVGIAEIKAAEQARFAAIDGNGDGVISADELSGHAMEMMQERMAKRFARMLEWQDADGDGALNPSEFGSDRAQMMFSRADTNNDGELTSEEFEQAKSHSRGGRAEGKRRHGG